MPNTSVASIQSRPWLPMSDWPELSWDGAEHIENQQLEAFRRRLYAIFKIWRGRPGLRLERSRRIVQPGLPDDMQVVLNEWGMAIAACVKHDDEGKDLWVGIFHPNKGWSTPINLTRGADPSTGYPQLAISRRGEAVCLWRQGDAAHAGVWASRYSSGSGWARPCRLDQPAAHGDTFAPLLAVNRFGHGLAAWQYSTTPELMSGSWTDVKQSSSIWVSTMQPNGHWSPAYSISQEPSSDASQLQIGIDNDGLGMAVWRQVDQAATTIWYSRQLAEDEWTRPRQIRSNLPGSALEPCLKMNSRGDAILAWVQVHGGQSQVWTCCFDPRNGWGEALALTEPAFDFARQPRLSINDDGSAMLLWQSTQADEEEQHIKTCSFLPEQGWGKTVIIQTVNHAGIPGQPCVAISNSHHSIAMWQRIRNSRLEVCARVHHPSYGWGTVRVLAQSDGGDADACALYGNVTAHVFATWLKRDTMSSEAIYSGELTHPMQAFAQAEG